MKTPQAFLSMLWKQCELLQYIKPLREFINLDIKRKSALFKKGCCNTRMKSINQRENLKDALNNFSIQTLI